MNCKSTRMGSRGERQGVVLMIMLSLLALFTVMAVTFVVASGQFRRGAAIASRAEQTGDPFDVLLQQAMMQIVRGSRHPHSAVGPHGLLEDMYGNSDAVTGCVMLPGFQQKNSLQAPNQLMLNEIGSWSGVGEPMLLKMGGVSFGFDRQPGNAMTDDDNNGVVDDISELAAPSSDDRYIGSTTLHPFMVAVPGGGGSSSQLVDNVDNYYSGRVITFVSGSAAGQSCYILRSKVFYGNPPQTLFYVSPPQNGKKPGNYDRFVINGRPFNGAGFGASPYVYSAAGLPTGMKQQYVTASFPGGPTVPNPRLRMLDQPYHSPVEAANATMQVTGKLPIAFTPNPVDTGYREYLAKFSPFVEADEDYDIADAQNMLLAGRQWNANTRRFETIAPSLHRPDLVNYVMRNSLVSPYSAGLSNPRWTDIPPSVRRRIILRPDPVDHYDYTQENVLNPINSDGWTPGEPFVDVNQNGTWDPYVVSLGGPEIYQDLNGNGGYDVGDRAYYNTNFDAVRGPWDVDNDNDGSPDSIWVDLGAPVATDAQGRMVKPLFAIMVIDLDGRVNVNAHGSNKELATADPEYENIGATTGAVPTYPAITGTTNWLIRPKPTLPGLYPSGHLATEEKNMMGSYYFGTSSSVSLQQAINRLPIVGSALLPGQYAGMSTTEGLKVRWASAYLNDHPYNDYTTAYNTGQLTLTMMNTLNPMRVEPAFGQAYGVHDVNMSTAMFSDFYGLPHLGSSGTSLSLKPSRPNRTRTMLIRKYGEDHLSRNRNMYSTSSKAIEPRAGATRTDLSDPAMLGDFSAFYGTATLSLNDDNIPAPPTGVGPLLGNSVRDSFNAVVAVSTGTTFLLAQGSPTDDRLMVGDYGTPPDLDSDGATGLDLSGQPLFLNMGLPGETVDEPSEMVLNRRYFPKMIVGGATTTGGRGTMAHRDAPYTPAELERLLRIRDPGSVVLPKRLDNLFYDHDPEMPYLFTTESWDIPCPHIAPTPELAAALRDMQLPVSNPTLGDLLRARFYLTYRARGGIQALTASQLATVSMRSYLAGAPNNISRLFSADLGLGLRMDVNAPFGNSVDDNGNYVVDEPGENNPILGGLAFDGNRDGVGSGTNEMARQQYAKELYCLMMLLIDENYVMPLQQAMSGTTTVEEVVAPAGFIDNLFPHLTVKNWPGAETPAVMKAKRWLTARRIAQWAVNVVDARDRDAIMTPFEFDVDPFNDNDSSSAPTSVDVNNPGATSTWDVDGYLTSDECATVGPDDGNWFRGVVWGCEYPDLLLSETLAYHDRRTQNTMHETDNTDPLIVPPITGTFKLTQSDTAGLRGSPITTTGAVPQSLDPHWDQARRPEGSAFIEVYATGNWNNPTLPRELYDRNELELGKVVQGSPVWRLAITQGRIRHEDSNRFSLTGGTRTTLSDNDVAMRLARNPGTCSLDPADAGFSILPWVNHDANANINAPGRVIIERVVTFCSTTTTVAITATNGLYTPSRELTPTYTGSNRIDVFHAFPLMNGPLDTDPMQPVRLKPGHYAVIAPHRVNATPSGGGSLLNVMQAVSTIGYTEKEGLRCTGTLAGSFTATTSGTGALCQPPAAVAITTTIAGTTRTNGFLVSSPNGSVDYPIHNFIDSAALDSVNPDSLGTLVNFNTTPNVDYNQIQPPVAFGCVAVAQGVSNPTGTNVAGFNISEPTFYERNDANYPYKPMTASVTMTTHVSEWDNRLTRAGDALTSADPTQKYDDVPWDGYAFDTGVNDELVFNPQLPHAYDHTTLRYKSVFLQRLANPLVGWNAVTNPYITMDWMPFDLTVMNGAPFWLANDTAERSTQLSALTLAHMREPGSAWDRRPNIGAPAQTVVAMSEDVRIRFGSRQRGAPRYPFKGNYSNLNLWGQPDWLDFSFQGSTLPPLTNHVIDGTATTNKYQLGYYNDRMLIQTGVTTRTSAAPTTAQPYFFFCKWQDPLQHSLGYINEGYQYRLKRDQQFNPVSSFATSPSVRPSARSAGDLNAAYGWLMGVDFKAPNKENRDYSTDSPYVGAPWRPFNWLTCNNRPFSSAMELMVVPAVGPSRLLHEFDMRRPPVPANANATSPAQLQQAPAESTRSGNHYLPAMSLVGQRGFLIRPPYGHLLNFFESSSAVPAVLGPSLTSVSPNPPLIGSLPIAWPGPIWPQSAAVSANTGQTYMAANFFRIFEFLTVPSRFSGLQQLHRNTPANNAYTTSQSVIEHPGWPFTAPFNSISLYREPGRVNLNTIPLLPNRGVGSGSQPESCMANSNSSGVDSGAGVWRAVTNEFHPKLRALNNGDTSNAARSPSPGLTPILRANQIMSGIGFNRHWQPWNPSQTTAENFFNLYASLHSDNPTKDPRGPDGFMGSPIGGGSADDTIFMSLEQRCDPQRPSLFSNPIRSYLEGYGAVVPNVPNSSGTTPLESYVSSLKLTTNPAMAPQDNPFLQIDSTLLRRRDTTWNPWDVTPSMWPTNSAQSNTSLPQLDVAFDPMFALNFPRPFNSQQSSGLPYTGYSINMMYRSGFITTATSPENVFGSRSDAQNSLSRTTDYRNTDRSAFFRYQLYNKLGTIATTRSNVYAIWVTVGYFEVEKVHPSQALPSQEVTGFNSGMDLPVQYRFPDGFRIVREMGSDTGEVERHKAFAIFDRTIPVGFLRGENLNADQAFLVRRILY